MATLDAVYSARGRSGQDLPASQPVAGSVTGSPFSVTDALAVATPAIDAGLVWVHPTTPVHIRISRAGTAATVNNMLLPGGQITQLAWRTGDILSMIAPASGTPVVHVEAARAHGQEV